MNRLGGPRAKSGLSASPLRIILISLGVFVLFLYVMIQYTFIQYAFSLFRFPAVHNPQWLILYLAVAILLPLLLLWPLIVMIKKKRKGWIIFSVVSMLLCMLMGFGYGNMVTVAPPHESRCESASKYLMMDDAALEEYRRAPALFPETLPEGGTYSYKFGYIFYPYCYLDIQAEFSLPEAEYASEKARLLALLAEGDATDTGVTLSQAIPVTEPAVEGQEIPEGANTYRTLSAAWDDQARVVTLAFSVSMEETAYLVLGAQTE